MSSRPNRSAPSQLALSAGDPERVLGARKLGGGQQLEIQWHGRQATTWEAASRMRRQYPLLVQAFEQQSAEGETDETMQEEETDVEQSGGAPGPAQDSAAMQKRLDEMSRLIEQQAQRAEEQQALIAQLRGSPAHSPQPSVNPSPQPSPQQQARNLAAAAATAAAAQSVSRFARKEPRATDLREYDGASGDKLDAWLDELGAAVELYELGEREAVLFAASRLREAARQWWNALGASGKAAVKTTDALAQAMRARFQPITAAHTARVQLDKLAQGPRSVNEYIADFQRLRTRLPNMAEDDALHAFKRGLRSDIAQDLRKQRVATLADAISLAAHVGSDGGAQGSKASLHQMDVDDGDGSASRLDRIEAALNAMHARDTSGMGAKTQTHHGYTQQRDGQRGGRGGFHGGRGRGGRGFGQRGPPEVPGVSEQVVRQRMDAQPSGRLPN